jgi:O-antigen/teichoic acid export membrane protein
VSDAREEPRAVEAASHAHGLLRDVLIYGAGGVGLQLLLSLLVPIFTRIFTTEDYGTIEAIATTVLVLSLLATLGLESASQRSYFDYGDEQTEERRSVLSTTFWVLLSTSVVWGGAIVVFRGPVAELLFDDRGPATALALAGAALPLTILAGFFLEVLRMRRRPTSYTLVAGVAGVAGVAFALLFAGVLDRGLPGYYAGLLVGGAVAVVVGFGLVRDSLGFSFDAGKLRVMLAYGLPLVPVAASTWVLQFVDRYFLLHYSTRADLGLYGVGARLSNFLLLGVTAFALAWSPFMLELHHRDAPAERAARGRVLTLLVIALCSRSTPGRSCASSPRRRTTARTSWSACWLDRSSHSGRTPSR